MATTKERVQYLLELRDKFSKNLGSANKQLGALERQTKLVNSAVRGLIPAFSIGAAVSGIKTVTKLFEGEEQAIAQVKQGLQSTGNSVGRTFKQISAQADALQKKTVFGNEATLQGVSAQLLTFTNVSGTTFDRAQKAVLDLTARLDGPRAGMEALRGKAIQVGKALNDPITGMAALSRSGITFSESQKQTVKDLVKTGKVAEAQSLILNELEKQYGGSAEAAAKTATGKLIQFENRMGDIGEQIGGALIPHLLSLAEKFENLVSFVQKNQETFKTLAKITVRLVAAYGAYKLTIIATRKAKIAFLVIQRASIIANVLFTKGIKKARIAMKLFNITTKANPLGLVIASLTILVPLLYKAFSSTKKLSSLQKASLAINKKANDIFADQAGRLRVLKTTLEAGNVTQKQRGEIINEINKTYGQYLDNLLTEKSTDEDIAKAIKTINDELLRKARIQAGKDIIAENAKEAIKLERELRNEKLLTEKANEGFLNNVGRITAKLSLSEKRYMDERVADRKKDLRERLAALNAEDKAILKITNTEITAAKKVNQAGNKKGAGSANAVLGKSDKKTLETGIKAGSPKVINVNIDKLIESFNIETKQIKEAPIRIKEMVTVAVLDAMNDAMLLQK